MSIFSLFNSTHHFILRHELVATTLLSIYTSLLKQKRVNSSTLVEQIRGVENNQASCYSSRTPSINQNFASFSINLNKKLAQVNAVKRTTSQFNKIEMMYYRVVEVVGMYRV